MFTSPGEIAFNIGNLSVHYYGICISLGIVLGLIVSYFVCKTFYKDINADVIFDIATPIIIGGIIGARLYYCLLSINYYIIHPLEIIQIYQGGLSIHGAILGGLTGGIIYAKKKNLPILKLCDIFSFGLISGQILGRWGNFFNSEAFGFPCSHFLKLYIPFDKRPFYLVNYEYFHPVFLYESLANTFILLVLFAILQKKPKSGKIFFIYLILYSIIRIFLELLRVDSVLNVFGFPIAFLISILIIFISCLALRKI